ncbi:MULTISPECIES: TetR/AcrR family transcriptional regulator [unclassified Streptomyces]|uniref:TetR/AcrR family transcriptional regulator n=1 Tax=unclassified Streptomyces TaxID=2593676 RepID=UPI001BE6BF39|nr:MULTISPECIES: TetR family transcriptional regulator [unclassified Streptomyces]MBT2402232.1 TetR family transcriptional regulator [Streptomyces sp. ISL-21]MBT2456425.1 TetR family transcriptional regulator [Streptomyces sp. ISL-86]MBT2606821.1 TetR family transcriptional regulator [Streptomyces sp. ISL-87]
MPAGVRRYDPERRQRIIDAAIRVVGAKGIAGLSHRSVAAEADVPLGSTTYHFKTLDDLLVAALRQANEAFTVPPPAPGDDLARSLARLLGELLSADRGRAELEYELYLEALRRPALRPVAAQWCESVTAALAQRVDPVTARALVAVMDGICLQVLLTDTEYDEPYARDILGRVLRPGEPFRSRH